MMKSRPFFTLILLVVLLAACASAPAGSATPANPSAATQPSAAVAPTVTVAVPTLEPTTASAPGEEPTVLPVATSRGPELHATDPTTVSLASGGLQFVEFFRFT